MMKNQADIHEQLKIALHLFNSTISSYAQTLISPRTGNPISHTAVIRVAQGHVHIPWIRRNIEQTITKAQNEHPSYFQTNQGLS